MATSNQFISDILKSTKPRKRLCKTCERSQPNQISYEKMQMKQNGLPVKTVKSFMSKIPSVFTGTDMVHWLQRNLELDDLQEAIHLANLIASHGYIFPIDDHTLSIKNDYTFYRFQAACLWPSKCNDPESIDYAVYLCKRTMQDKTRLELADYEAENLANLQKKHARKWELIFMEAESQVKIDRKRNKLDRRVFDSQERAFWDVHRPVPGCVNTTEIDIKKVCRMSRSNRSVCQECSSLIGSIGSFEKCQKIKGTDMREEKEVESSSNSDVISSSEIMIKDDKEKKLECTNRLDLKQRIKEEKRVDVENSDSTGERGSEDQDQVHESGPKQIGHQHQAHHHHHHHHPHHHTHPHHHCHHPHPHSHSLHHHHHHHHHHHPHPHPHPHPHSHHHKPNCPFFKGPIERSLSLGQENENRKIRLGTEIEFDCTKLNENECIDGANSDLERVSSGVQYDRMRRLNAPGDLYPRDQNEVERKKWPSESEDNFREEKEDNLNVSIASENEICSIPNSSRGEEEEEERKQLKSLGMFSDSELAIERPAGNLASGSSDIFHIKLEKNCYITKENQQQQQQQQQQNRDRVDKEDEQYYHHHHELDRKRRSLDSSIIRVDRSCRPMICSLPMASDFGQEQTILREEIEYREKEEEEEVEVLGPKFEVNKSELNDMNQLTNKLGSIDINNNNNNNKDDEIILENNIIKANRGRSKSDNDNANIINISKCDTINRDDIKIINDNNNNHLDSIKLNVQLAQCYLSFAKLWAEYDPFITQPIPSNPWLNDSTDFWDSEHQTKEIHGRRVRRWAFSLKELLNDLAGRAQFYRFLEKEFSAENLKFWDAVQELKKVHNRDVIKSVEAIWTEYLAPDANCPINIDSKSYEATKVKLERNKNNRYIFDEAASHVYQLMKNDSYTRYLRSDMYKDYKDASEKKRSAQATFDVFKPQITTLKHKFNFN